MNNVEFLATFLQNTYFVGCGDAGVGTQFTNLHNQFFYSDAKMREELSAGEGMTFLFDGEKISQKEYFLRLANLLMEVISS